MEIKYDDYDGGGTHGEDFEPYGSGGTHGAGDAMRTTRGVAKEFENPDEEQLRAREKAKEKDKWIPDEQLRLL